MHLTADDIRASNRIKRLNLINAITGIKPANLIGTINQSGHTNLAIFSSLVHLGSNPALLGFIVRPTTVPRHTYQNIMHTGYYTINHIPQAHIEQAHYTSAKFPAHLSEFDTCAFTPSYRANFKAPFVAECPVQIGMQFVQSIPIPTNNTILVIGKIVHLFIPDAAVTAAGHINLEQLTTVGIGGLNSYYALKKIGQFDYAHLHTVPNFASPPKTLAKSFDTHEATIGLSKPNE